MAEFLQSEQRRGTYKETALKAKLASGFPRATGESLELGPLPLALVQILFQETQTEGPAASQVPTGAIIPSREPTQPPGKPVPVTVCSLLLHASWVHGPGPLAGTEACHRRGLGHRLQPLLGLPDVVELLELLHHAVFEVWV